MTKSKAETRLFDDVEADSPTEMRRQVAELARMTIGADAAIFCRYGVDDQRGRRRTITVVGPDRLVDALNSEVGDRSGRFSGAPSDPPETFESQFGTIRHEGQGDGGTSDLGELFRRLDIRQEASALLYDGLQCLGWLGVFRLGEGTITEANVETLDGLIASATNILGRAEKREAFLYRETPGQFVFNSTSREIEYRSANARMWLTEKRGERVMARFDELESRDYMADRFCVDGYAIQTTLLSGESGVRVLASIEQLPLPEKRPEAVLTPRQREVAEYAASGATNREIAEALGITPDTVGDHLTACYERLGVTNRVELTRRLME